MTRLDVASVALGTTLLIFLGAGGMYLALTPPEGSTVITGALPMLGDLE